MFPKIIVPQNGWFIREIPIKMDDSGGTPPIIGAMSLRWKPPPPRRRAAQRSATGVARELWHLACLSYREMEGGMML